MTGVGVYDRLVGMLAILILGLVWLVGCWVAWRIVRVGSRA